MMLVLHPLTFASTCAPAVALQMAMTKLALRRHGRAVSWSGQGWAAGTARLLAWRSTQAWSPRLCAVQRGPRALPRSTGFFLRSASRFFRLLQHPPVPRAAPSPRLQPPRARSQPTGFWMRSARLSFCFVFAFAFACVRSRPTGCWRRSASSTRTPAARLRLTRSRTRSTRWASSSRLRRVAPHDPTAS
jgi:hypothetical protein